MGILTYSTILYHLVTSFDKSAPIYKQTLRELNLGVYKDVISCPSSTSIAQGREGDDVLIPSSVYVRKQEYFVNSGNK